MNFSCISAHPALGSWRESMHFIFTLRNIDFSDKISTDSGIGLCNMYVCLLAGSYARICGHFVWKINIGKIKRKCILSRQLPSAGWALMQLKFRYVTWCFYEVVSRLVNYRGPVEVKAKWGRKWPSSPSATGGLYNISSTEGLTIGFDGHFSPLKEFPGLKFQIVSNRFQTGKNGVLPLF